MPILRYKNNAKSLLASGINTTATSLTVSSGQGSLFPVTSATDQFYITISKPTDFLINEIVLCTSRSGDTFTIVRAQQGTTAKNWLIGDKVAQWMTAGDMENFMQTENLTNVDNPPIGTILPFAGYSWNIPNSWRICDGTLMSSATYTTLFQVLGYTYGGSGGYFNLPDLRGMFVRARQGSVNSPVDPYRGIGTIQQPAVRWHVHSVPQAYTVGYSEVSTGSWEAGGAYWPEVPSGQSPSVQGYTTVTGIDETRPVNMAMHYIIRVKKQFTY